jgi:hypothetical protein
MAFQGAPPGAGAGHVSVHQDFPGPGPAGFRLEAVPEPPED